MPTSPSSELISFESPFDNHNDELKKRFLAELFRRSKNIKNNPFPSDQADWIKTLHVFSETLRSMTDSLIQLNIIPLCDLIKKIRTNPCTIQRDMFLDKDWGDHGVWITSKYKVQFDRKLGSLDVNVSYDYTYSNPQTRDGQPEIREMDVDSSTRKLPDISYLWLLGNPTETRVLHETLITSLPWVLDDLYEKQTNTKTPNWRDFINTEFNNVYSEMMTFCDQVEQGYVKPQKMHDIVADFDKDKTKEIISRVTNLVSRQIAYVIKTQIDDDRYYIYRNNEEKHAFNFYNSDKYHVHLLNFNSSGRYGTDKGSTLRVPEDEAKKLARFLDAKAKAALPTHTR